MMLRSKLLILLLIGLILSSWVPAEAQDDGPVYIVQEGDTLFGIARRFGTTVDDILAINAIADSARIFPGTKLTIPGFPGISGVLKFTAVEFGDSLETIALRFPIDVDDLARLNRLVRPEAVYAGQLIIVPEPEDTEFSASSGGVRMVYHGQTRLGMAARERANPWDFNMATGEMVARWQLPGMVLINRASNETSPGFLGPLKSVTVNPSPLIQGQTVVIKVNTDRTVLVEGSLGEHELGFFPIGEHELVALQGIHALAEPGLRTFALEVIDSQSGVPIYSFQQPILLVMGGYGSTVLNGVPPETIDPSITQPEEQLIAEVLAPKSPAKSWEGSFEYPSRYYTKELLAGFGTRRSYNNGALHYYHTGVDFYGQNVPIYAPASGYIIFTGSLAVRGNVTYIDHGWGVYSGYLHQAEIFVEEGEFVESGAVIGQVGNTGRSIGPHLHWEIWVGGVPVEPITWIDNNFP